jgi:hypothetical protein
LIGAAFADSSPSKGHCRKNGDGSWANVASLVRNVDSRKASRDNRPALRLLAEPRRCLIPSKLLLETPSSADACAGACVFALVLAALVLDTLVAATVVSLVRNIPPALSAGLTVGTAALAPTAVAVKVFELLRRLMSGVTAAIEVPPLPRGEPRI